MIYTYSRCQKKSHVMAFNQYLTCQIFPVRLARFRIKTSCTEQCVHLFSMNFNDFRSFLLCFSLKCPFPMNKSLLCGKTIYMRLPSIKGLNAILPGLICFISIIISVPLHGGFQPLHTFPSALERPAMQC